jgi:mercuric reductase
MSTVSSRRGGTAGKTENGAFDLIVLGGGSAGFAAAIKGADLGARVAIIESGTLGGTCVNVGCIPSKTLLRAAEAQHKRTYHGFAGISSSNGVPDWTAVRAHKDELVATLRREKYADVLMAYPSVALIRQRAAFASEHTLALFDGTTLTADKIIIATGASPSAPRIVGLDQAGYLDNVSAMALDELPKSLAVIGGGSVGLELAQMFARLGVVVTVLEALPHVLPMEDPSVADALAQYVREEGLSVVTDAQIERVTKREGKSVIAFRSGGEGRTMSVERVLVATGRRPNTTGVGLEAAHVGVNVQGGVEVNEFLETSNSGVYAVGDVIGNPMFVYVAAYAGNLAAENALRGNARRYDLTAVPSVTFTDPAVASIGLTEDAAWHRGIDAMVAQLGLEHVPRARAARDTRGFIRLIADRQTQQIIGAQILAAEAGEMIGEATLAVRLGLTIEQMTTGFRAYLTLGEGLKLAAQTFTTDVSKLSCCAA